VITRPIYACLNLNIFTTELEGRQSTSPPWKNFITKSSSTSQPKKGKKKNKK